MQNFILQYLYKILVYKFIFFTIFHRIIILQTNSVFILNFVYFYNFVYKECIVTFNIERLFCEL